MIADLLPLPRAAVAPLPRSVRTPDLAYDAAIRYRRLAAALQTTQSVKHTSRWKEPALFFFDPQRQRELEATQPSNHVVPDGLQEQIAAEMPGLFASVELRRLARAVPGLREAALQHPAGSELGALLSVIDDETVLVLHPQTRSGFRLLVRGIADIAQFHVLLLDAIAEQGLSVAPLPSRFRLACAERNPVIPAGVPMIVESPFQFFLPAALQPNGDLPTGFRGCQHWLWGTQPMARIPRFIRGERVLLLGEAAFRQVWEVERRFPSLPAEVRILEALNPFKVLEHLSRIVARPLPIHASIESGRNPDLERAA